MIKAKEGHDAPCEDPPSIEAVVPPKNEKMSPPTQLFSSKALENESSFVVFPSLGRSLPDESHFRKVGQPRKKDNLN